MNSDEVGRTKGPAAFNILALTKREGDLNHAKKIGGFDKVFKEQPKVIIPP